MKAQQRFRPVQRLFDVIAAGIALIILAPFIAILWIAVRISMGKPAFFRQQRIGLNNQPFYLVKFRTMLNTTDGSGRLLPDHERLTRIGTWIRRLSLDELPQFWNVVRGDMSLVGPRPLLPEYLPRYLPSQRRRHEVRPGITGWAQVNGRNTLSWEQKFEHDVWYVDHCSFRLDLKILWMTVIKTIARSDISSAGHATMPEFMGYPARDEPGRMVGSVPRRYGS